ncbi:MAG: DUF2179 domain-containing protein [Syntrophales bacterium]|jgi:uncharacterized protein YebE (UPF0316 family)|nr:DUF2179 domain-containing protein [Syntrophales bacterium]MCK9527381.1 DUF2179 domain-containing protein [Syntrophales bacterium]MDX9921483.1 DUF2179 domain-containing protein [Syntrophales bacterium]
MDFTALVESSFFSWVIIPLLIFSARIVDVSLGTIRIIYVARGLKFLSPILGFFELMIWLLAISQIFRNFASPLYYLAYAGGFATGNFVGIILEERLAMGRVVIRIITQIETTNLIASLRKAGYGVTVVDAAGSTGPVKLIFTVVDRKEMETVIGMVQQFNPRAFFSVEDVRVAKEGIFPASRNSAMSLLNILRKGK